MLLISKLHLMHQKEFDELLDKYIRGLCNPEEEKLIHQFFQSYQQGKKPWQPGEAQQARQEIYDSVKQQIHKKEAMPAKTRPAMAGLGKGGRDGKYCGGPFFGSLPILFPARKRWFY